VVSVSNTISRIKSLFHAPAWPARRNEAARTIHDKIGAPALFLIGGLPGEEACEFLFGHSGPFEYACALHIGRRRDHDHGIAAPRAADFEQERDIENDDGIAAGLRRGEELVPRFADQRVHDGLKPCQRRLVIDDHGGELAAIDLAAGGAAGKGRLDGGSRAAFVKRMHGGVGIVHRHAGLGEELRGCGFAHADRAGQTQHKGSRGAHWARYPWRRRKSNAVVNGRPKTVK
jgi:hypothetical protein